MQTSCGLCRLGMPDRAVIDHSQNGQLAGDHPGARERGGPPEIRVSLGLSQADDQSMTSASSTYTYQ